MSLKSTRKSLNRCVLRYLSIWWFWWISCEVYMSIVQACVLRRDLLGGLAQICAVGSGLNHCLQVKSTCPGLTLRFCTSALD
jgi:hypothetical protein